MKLKSSRRPIITSLLLIACAVLSMMFTESCSNTSTTVSCNIEGTAPTSLNGKKIYLVPLFGPRDKAHVDSAVITDGKFQISTDTLMMAMLRVDFKYRFGTQDLLVVTEDGTIHATIGALSHAGGTSLNDSLQAWKDLTEACKKEQKDLYVSSRKYFEDKQKLEEAKQKAIAIQDAYLARTRQMKANVKPSVLYDFFEKMLPDSTSTTKASTQASKASAQSPKATSQTPNANVKKANASAPSAANASTQAPSLDIKR